MKFKWSDLPNLVKIIVFVVVIILGVWTALPAKQAASPSEPHWYSREMLELHREQNKLLQEMNGNLREIKGKLDAARR